MIQDTRLERNRILICTRVLIYIMIFVIICLCSWFFQVFTFSFSVCFTIFTIFVCHCELFNVFHGFILIVFDVFEFF